MSSNVVEYSVSREMGARNASVSETSFRQIFVEHYQRITQILLRVLGSLEDAEELADEAFVRLYAHLSSRGGDENVGGWLYRTATRLAFDALRSRRRRRQYEHAAALQRPVATDGDALRGLLRSEQQRLVRQALARMKDKEARILVMRHSGLSYKEIGEALDLKATNIGTMLVRAEERFARIYQEVANNENAVHE